MKKYSLAIIIALVFAGRGVQSAPPARIVSLKPNITDIVYALGAGDGLVGVTRYCDVPLDAQKPAIVADYTQPYTEKIIALAPSVVLGSEENSSRSSVETLKRLGIDVKLFPFTTLSDTKTSMKEIGAAIGAPDKGALLSEKFADELDVLGKKWKNFKPKRVIIVWGTRPIVTAGPGTYMDELLGVIAAENAVKGTKIKYPRTGIEEMIALEPDAIIDLSMGNESGNGDRPWDGVSAIRAVRERRVITMDAGKFRAGPYLPKALETLAEALHRR